VQALKTCVTSPEMARLAKDGVLFCSIIGEGRVGSRFHRTSLGRGESGMSKGIGAGLATERVLRLVIVVIFLELGGRAFDANAQTRTNPDSSASYPTDRFKPPAEPVRRGDGSSYAMTFVTGSQLPTAPLRLSGGRLPLAPPLPSGGRLPLARPLPPAKPVNYQLPYR
jgi:hypothetical protein